MIGIEAVVDNILEHHGVLGMKWGVRKGESGGAGIGLSKKEQKKLPTDVVVGQKKPGTKVKATGGRNQPASEDAKKAAATRQKARASTTDSLSNKELQDLVKRMQLEQQYSDLNARRASGGKKFVAKLLGGVGQQQAQRVANEAAAQQINKVMKKSK